MTAPTVTRYRGDTVADRFTITDAAGAAVDITGFTVTMTIDCRERPDDVTTQLYELVGTLVTPASGIVDFKPSALQADQEPGTYYYDIQLIDGASDVETVCVGVYVYVQDIGKST